MRESRYKPLILIIWAFLALLGALFCKGPYVRAFYNVQTGMYSANMVCRDFPPGPLSGLPALAKEFFTILPVYLQTYLIPAFTLLAGAVLLLWAAMDRIAVRREGFLDFTKLRSREIWLVLSILCIALVIMTYFHFFTLKDLAFTGDEYSYIFQGQILSAGKLFADSPPMRAAFNCNHIINNGRWYSKYTLGWPALLALGNLIGAAALVAPLCGVLSLLLMYLLARKLFGMTAGFLALAFALLSPYFTFMGASYMNHTATGLFLLAFIYFILRTAEEDSMVNPVCAGLALILLVNTRHLDGVAALAGVCLWALWLVRRFVAPKVPLSKGGASVCGGGGCSSEVSESPQVQPGFKKIIKKALPILALFAAGVGILLLVNWLQNGSPFVFGYEKFDQSEKVSLGTHGHSLLRAGWHIAFTAMRMPSWTVPYILVFCGFALTLRDRRVNLLLLVAALIAAGYYAASFSLGMQEFGVRYIYSSYVLLYVAAAGGAVKAAEVIGKKSGFAPRFFAPALLVIITLFSLMGNYRILVPATEHYYFMRKEYDDALRDDPAIVKPAILFVAQFPIWDADACRNRWEYVKEDILVAVSYTDEENKALMRLFPDRTPYLMVQDINRGIFISPYNPERVNSGDGYYRAFNNHRWWKTGLDEKVLREGLKKNPDNLTLQACLGNLCLGNKRYNEALAVYLPLVEKIPQSNLFYSIARCYGGLGDYRNALLYLDRYLDEVKQPTMELQAKAWIRYYMKKPVGPEPAPVMTEPAPVLQDPGGNDL